MENYQDINRANWDERAPAHEKMTKDDRGEWLLTDRPWRLAASYTLQAVKLT